MLALVATGVLFGGAAAALSTGATSEDEPTDSPTITVTEAPEPDTEASANSSAEGPNVTGAPKFGLCAAYFAGQGRENGNKSESSAFQALTAAAESSPGATDEERVATFCADVLDDDSPGNSGDHRADGDDNSSNGANNGAGSGANNGAGNAGGGNEIADDASNGKAGGKASEHQP
jgi:hypothetical protein